MDKSHEKTVIFDLGNVLLSFDFRIAANQLAKHSKIAEEEIVTLINQSKLLHQFERGEINSMQFYSEVTKACGYEKDLEQFSKDFSDIFEEIHPMVEFFKQLKRNGYKVALFSNTNEMATDFIRKQFSFLDEFDEIFLSYEHGIMKPTPSLYRIVESTLKKKGKDLFFIDDRPENIETAINLGWSGIIHTEAGKTINAVNSWLTASY